MIIPEIIIYNAVNKFLDFLIADYKQAGENCSLLYQIFYQDDNGNQMIYQDYNWYEQAKVVLLRTNESTRQIHINIGYNLSHLSTPTIHIVLPTEGRGRFDSIGQGETNAFPDNCNNLLVTKEITHNSTYSLLITSDNVNEVLIMYYFLQAMFLVFNDTFGLLGLINIKTTGQDLQVDQNLVPPNIFHRNFAINFDWDSQLNLKLNQSLLSGFNLSICENFATDTYKYLNNEEDSE